MADFKKSSNATDFEEQIKKLVLSYENKLSDQKDRIFALVEENKKLFDELNQYKEKDSQISKTLMVAVQKAKEIEDAAKRKYNMEIERLKLFHFKWTAYYTTLKNKLPVSSDMLAAEEFLLKMDKILGFESNITKDDASAVAQFLAENKRLNNIESKPDTDFDNNINNNIDDDFDTNSDFDDSAATLPPENIDLNEVLNPKNLPPLEDLIKEISNFDK